MKKYHRRGEVYFANLGRGVGSEQNGHRPVVIIQNDVGNRHSPTTIVAAVSTQIQGKAELPTHYHLTGGCCLKQPSIVLLEQLRTIDKHRLGRRIGTLSRKDIAAMDQALKISVGLNNAYNRKE